MYFLSQLLYNIILISSKTFTCSCICNRIKNSVNEFDLESTLFLFFTRFLKILNQKSKFTVHVMNYFIWIANSYSPTDGVNGGRIRWEIFAKWQKNIFQIFLVCVKDQCLNDNHIIGPTVTFKVTFHEGRQKKCPCVTLCFCSSRKCNCVFFVHQPVLQRVLYSHTVKEHTAQRSNALSQWLTISVTGNPLCTKRPDMIPQDCRQRREQGTLLIGLTLLSGKIPREIQVIVINCMGSHSISLLILN